jgi:hypothetical protein
MPKILRTPLMAIPATAGGALVGWWVWPIVASLAIAALDAIYRGFPIILYHWLCYMGAVLGGATAFAFIMSLGRWRRVAGWLLIFAALAGLVWSAPLAWDFMRSDGRRLALAVYGLPMLWACALGLWGYRMQKPCDDTNAA